MPTQPWQRVAGGPLVVASAGFLGLCYWLQSDEDGFIGLDYVNLVFHEAGHLIFGLLGPTVALYGGTIGQLVFPLVVTGLFFRQRDAIAFTVGLVWTFENLLNIARYMADARMQVLPLVGGEGHDWTDILGRWGVLAWDTRMAGVVRAVAWMGMLAAWGWLLWRYVESARAKSL